MSLEEIISNYGYAALLIGTFIEGETILVLAGFAAHRGYLNLPLVITCAFIGTLLGDQVYFYIGRIKGSNVVEKYPKWKSRSTKVFALMSRHQTLLIIGFRFFYGMRTITPFLLGASGVSPVRFLVLNIIGAACWATAFGTLGYLFGQAAESLLGKLKHYEIWLFTGLALTGLLIWLFHFLPKKSKHNKSSIKN